MFLTVLAWLFGIPSTIFTGIRIVGYLHYSELEQLRDRMRGFKRSYSITISGTIALVCWAWIISTYL